MEDNIQGILFDLLLAADELILPELVKYMGEYIITYERDWVQENLASIFSFVSKYKDFTRLWKYCDDLDDLLAQQPKILFTCSDFFSLKRSTLLEFIKRDDLNVGEIEIWKSLVRWARDQDPQLDREDFKGLENRLKDFIPFIRFFHLTKDQYTPLKFNLLKGFFLTI